MPRERSDPAPRLTTTIERQWLSEIVDGTKVTEYRQLKPYWTKKLEKVGVPFDLRLISGMYRKAPEVTVRIVKVRRNRAKRHYALHIGAVLSTRYWNKQRKAPTYPAPHRVARRNKS